MSETQIIEIAHNDFVTTCTHRKSKKSPAESCSSESFILRAPSKAQLGIFGHIEPKLAYRLLFDVDSPRTLIEYTIDANNGQILKKLNLIQDFNGLGTVFDPNPVSAYYPTPVDNNDANNPRFNPAYTTRGLIDITFQSAPRNSFFLTGLTYM